MINEKSAKHYCSEDISKIENYDQAVADQTLTWCIHHRREESMPASALVAIGEYYNRPACELIFLTQEEHSRLHHRGKVLSDLTKQRISKSKKGQQAWLGLHHTEETKKKISAAKRGKHYPNISAAKRGRTVPKLSSAKKGLHWYNNGSLETQAFECPAGFVKGRLKYN